MAIPSYALLIDSPEQNSGLKAIRERESDLIDISSFVDDNACGDSTSASNTNNFIKNNKVYRIKKVYMDLDKNKRIFLGFWENNSNDKLD